MPSPPSAAAAASAISAGPPPSRKEPAPAEETGPVFLDEDAGPGAGAAQGAAEGTGRVPAARDGESLPEVRPRGEVAPAASIDWDDPGRLHGLRPEPASAWQADAARQTGFAGQREERVSWGSGEGGDRESGEPAAPADPRGGWGRGGEEGRTDSGADGRTTSGAGSGAAGVPAASPPADGTFQMRAVSPDALANAAREAHGSGGAQPPEHTVGLRRPDVSGPKGEQGPSAAAPAVPGPPAQPQTPQPHAQQAPQVPPQVPPAHSGFGQNAPAQPAAPTPHSAGQQAAPRAPEVPQQPSWAQQVQDLAGRGAGPEQHHAAGQMGAPHGQHGAGPDAVTPWRPPVSDPFLQAAAAQDARPAALGKRFGARVVDGLLTSVVAVGVGFPFAGQAVDHIEQKTEAVRLAGETRTVWLLDATTGGYLVLVLGALILFGVLYEVLPTRRWGRTLGKKLFGLKVLTMEQQERPGFGSAFVRWLTHGALSVLLIGVVNVLWCVFDRPWRQCWHDKLAGTFVTGDSGELRL